MPDTHIPETIDEYIEKYASGLLPIIQHSKGSVIVSGSTVLYYYMIQNGIKPTFVPGDLDIYHMDTEDVQSQWIEINNWFDDKFYEMDDFEKTQFIVSCYSGKIMGYQDPEHVTKDIPFPLRHAITHIRSGYKTKEGERNQNKKIDIISLNENFKFTPAEFIRDYFDFDFCKCWYDGYTLQCFFPEAVKEMKCNLTTIPMVRAMHIKPLDYIIYVENIVKENIPSELTRKTDPNNIFRRITKYRSRGFEINTQGMHVDKDALADLIKYEAIGTIFERVEEINNHFRLDNIMLWAQNVDLKFDFCDTSISRMYKDLFSPNIFKNECN